MLKEELLDESVLVKLCLSRDAHAESMRKILGKHNYEIMQAANSRVTLTDFFMNSDQSNASPTLSPSNLMTLQSKSFDSTVSDVSMPSNISINNWKVPEVGFKNSKSDPFHQIDRLGSAETGNTSKESIISDGKSIHDSHHRYSHEDYGMDFGLNTSSFSSTPTPTEPHGSPVPMSGFGSTDSYDKEPSPAVVLLTREFSNSMSVFNSVPNNVPVRVANTSYRNPLIAKRNPNIERMINEVVSKTNKTPSPKVGSERFFSTPRVMKGSSGNEGVPKAIQHPNPTSNTTKNEKRFTTHYPTKPIPKAIQTNIVLKKMTKDEIMDYRIDLARRVNENISNKITCC